MNRIGVRTIVLMLALAGLSGCGPTTNSQVDRNGAAYQQCIDLVTSVPGLTNWIQNVKTSVPSSDFVAGISESERITAYKLLKLNEEFSGQALTAAGSLSSGIIARTADIRQGGPGCVAHFDAITSLNRALPVVAGRMLSCALRTVVATYILMCPDNKAVANSVKNLVQPALSVLDERFAPPDLAYLQNLRPWDGATSDQTIYDSFATMGNSYGCFSWTGAFGLDAKKFNSYIESASWAAWEQLPPRDPKTGLRVSSSELPSLTARLYGTEEDLQNATQESSTTLKNMTTASSTAVRAAPADSILSTNLLPLKLDQLCSDVAREVDVLGGVPANLRSNTSLSNSGLLNRFYQGLTECKSGKLGSDYTKCLLTRVFIPVPSIWDAEERLELALSKLSYFELPNE